MKTIKTITLNYDEFVDFIFTDVKEFYEEKGFKRYNIRTFPEAFERMKGAFKNFLQFAGVMDKELIEQILKENEDRIRYIAKVLWAEESKGIDIQSEIEEYEEEDLDDLI